MTASGILYADHRVPSLDYSDLLKTTHAVTNHAAEVERMARLMVFNALTHNHDDHAKNFAFLHDQGRWTLAPAYDLTYSAGPGGEQIPYALFVAPALLAVSSMNGVRSACTPAAA